jgi:hypothetical protein
MMRCNQSNQSLVADIGVVKAVLIATGQTTHVQSVFRNINANDMLCHLFPRLCLSFGANSPGIRSGQEKDGAIKL